MANQLDLAVVVTLRDKLTPGLQKIVGNVSAIGAAARRVAAPVAKLGAALGALTGVGVAGALTASAGKMIGISAEFEKFETVLRTITGSSDEARRNMEWISDFAAVTPYEISDTTDAFVKLKAYGFDPLDGTLKTLGDTASAMGKSLMQAVEAIADAVTGENERLKEFGIKAKVEGDKIVYTWTQNGKKMTQSAERDNPESIRLTLLGILDRRFKGSMEAQSRTWNGMMSNISDSFTRFWLRVGQAGSFDSLKGGLRELLGWFDRQAANGNMQRWANDLSAAITRASESLKDLLFGAFEYEDRIVKRSGGLLDRLPEIVNAASAALKSFFAEVQSAYQAISPVVDLMGGPFKASLIAIAAINLAPFALAIAALAPVATALAAALAALASPIGLIVVACVAAAAGLIYLGKVISNNLDAILDGAKAKWEAFKTWLGSLGGQVVSAIQDGFGALRDAGAAMIQAIWDGATAKWEAFKSWLGSLGDKIGLGGSTPETQSAMPYRLGTADGGDFGAKYERSQRAQAELKQGTDMEAARGLAMRKVHGAGPAEPQQVQVDAKVEGEAAVKVDVQVQPSPDFITRVIRAVEARMPLRQTAVSTSPERGQSVLRP